MAEATETVWLTDEQTPTSNIIDAAQLACLAGFVGAASSAPSAPEVFLVLELVSIDPVTAQIISHHPVPGIESPHGIALDVDARLAFVAGEENNKLAVLDLTSGQVLATYPVGKDPDVLAFDPGLKLLYVSAESGNVTVFREKTARGS